MLVFRLAVVICVALFTMTGLAKEPHLQSNLERFSYAVGLGMARSMEQQGITKIDPAALALAIQDTLQGVPSRLTVEQMKQAHNDYRNAMLAEQRQQGARNLKDGQEFLTANGKHEGVITLESGVQYRVLKEGEGESPGIDDSVQAHYRGTLLDGREFDSSLGRPNVSEFPLSGVIAGWRQVVTRMRPGGVIETWIPPQHAYGERGSPPAIGPSATLYFRIELVAVIKKDG